MGQATSKLAAGFLSLVLAAGLCPAAAFASVGLTSGSLATAKTFPVSFHANCDNEWCTIPLAQAKNDSEDLVLSRQVPLNQVEDGFETTLDFADGVTPSETRNSIKTIRAEFVKWTTCPDGSGDSYYPGAVYAKNEKLDLYAQWAEPKTAISKIMLPAPTRAGCAFRGWRDASGELYQAGWYAPKGPGTLVACWSKNKKLLAKQVVEADVKAAIGSMTDSDVAGSTFHELQLKASAKAGRCVELTWKRVKGAKQYIVLGGLLGKGYAALANQQDIGFTHKGLKNARAYKYVVLAYDANGKRIATAKTAHVVTRGGKNANVKKVKLAKKSVKVKLKKSVKLKGKVVKAGKELAQPRKLRFESSNQEVAAVNATTGKVVAKKRGSCYVYAYACDGAFARCKVSVK